MNLEIVEVKRKLYPRKLGRPVSKRAKPRLKRKKGYKLLNDELVKVWKLRRADSAFSKEIIERDGKCLFPGCGKTTQLTCSHYIGRATKSTRFFKDNCITLCTTHHFWDKQLGWEFQKQRQEVHGWDGRYTLFMKERLGEGGFNYLLELAQVSVKQSDAIWAYQTYASKSISDQIKSSSSDMVV
jgi:hypothetical protein